MDWIKFYTRKWLWGSGRDMTAEERGVWADLLAMAGEAKFRDGTLRFDVGKPMPRSYIATVLRITPQLLDFCLDLFCKDINIEDGSPRVKIWEDGTIELTKFIELQGGTAEELKTASRVKAQAKQKAETQAKMADALRGAGNSKGGKVPDIDYQPGPKGD